MPAVFNRRPHPQEIVDLESNDTRDKLAERDTPMSRSPSTTVVSSSSHTNLGELERGLATVIATTLRTISVNVLATLQTAADNAEAARDRDLQRAQDITRAAERITFSRTFLTKQQRPNAPLRKPREPAARRRPVDHRLPHAHGVTAGHLDLSAIDADESYRDPSCGLLPSLLAARANREVRLSNAAPTKTTATTMIKSTCIAGRY